MDFSEALNLLKSGQFLCRSGWNGKGMYVFIIGGAYDSGYGHWTFTNGRNDNVAVLPFIAMKTADGKVVPWLISQTDALANDWEVYVELQ